MSSRILYTKPSITELEVGYATDAARNGWGDHCYDYIVKFENLFKEHVGIEFALSTSSCTGALHMGLFALGIGPGDEVILADTNWVATVAPVVHLGATPVFVDIDPENWCISADCVRKALTKKTKAIIAVHIYGNMCPMNELLSIGNEFGIPVIEDAAEAIGSEYFGKKAGSLGRFGTFSFHGTKTITTGEGGMFVTNDESLFSKVLTLSNHGRVKGQVKQFWPDEIGFKYKMSNVQAAIGCGQMERISELIERKKSILAFYKKELASIKGISLNAEPQGITIGGWMPTVVFEEKLNVTREKLQSEFSKNNIDARVFFWPLSSLPMFTDQPENTVAWDIPNRAINLPSYHDITEDELLRVIEVIKTSVSSN